MPPYFNSSSSSSSGASFYLLLLSSITPFICLLLSPCLFCCCLLSWLIRPILRGPEAALQSLLQSQAAKQTVSSLQQQQQQKQRLGDPIEEAVPSGETLEALRRSAQDEDTFNPSAIPKIWLGLLLPSLAATNAAAGAAAAATSAAAAAPAAAAAAGGFRCQGQFQCFSYDDFFVKAVPLLRLLHASLAFCPRLLLAVLGICKEFAAGVQRGTEQQDWRYRQLVSAAAATVSLH